MNVYFDTEFCSLWTPKPISFGFASSVGNLYIEVPFDINDCSDFTKQIVVPQLSGNRHTFDEAREEIRHYLAEFEVTPQLVSDFIGDWWLLQMLLPDVRQYAVPRCGHAPTIKLAAIRRSFNLREHHALDDAIALRIAEPALQRE